MSAPYSKGLHSTGAANVLSTISGTLWWCAIPEPGINQQLHRVIKNRCCIFYRIINISRTLHNRHYPWLCILRRITCVQAFCFISPGNNLRNPYFLFQHTIYTFQQSESQNDIDWSVILLISPLDQQTQPNPCCCSDGSYRCNYKLKKKKYTK